MPSPGCMKESDIFGQTCWVIIVSLNMQGVMQDHVPHVTGTWRQRFHMVRRGNRSWSGRKCIKDLSVCPWAPAFHSTWSPPGCVPKACCNSHEVGIALTEGSGIHDPQPKLGISESITDLHRERKGGGRRGTQSKKQQKPDLKITGTVKWLCLLQYLSDVLLICWLHSN